MVINRFDNEIILRLLIEYVILYVNSLFRIENMSITQFTMEEVRCFGERQTLEIRPLTFLVGENSTGKTTALACFHVLVDFLQGRGIDFNSHPYSMGTFKDIVRNNKKKEKTFKLGFLCKYDTEHIDLTIEYVEKTDGIEPVVNSLIIKFTDGKIEFKSKENEGRINRLVSYNQDENYYKIAVSSYLLNNNYSLFFLLPSFRSKSEGEISLKNYLEKKNKKSGKNRYQMLDSLRTFSIFSTSPIRSRPKRTYDPTREFNDPEGSDIPMYLTRIEATKEKDWDRLKQYLIEFGKRSKLFQNIVIKKLGHSLGAPFQLQFKIRGPTTNITDVGYGVSQILPILIQIINSGSNQKGQRSSLSNFTLIQQPEVHLHPRAQAELSSLLAELAKQGNQSFIVETHSDYMIDRARIEIRKGNIKPEDVSLIYFEPKGNIVKVHNIGFDEMANLINVPVHYRKFFLKETNRLMGFED